jgi:rRNA maturation protein Nop10
VAVGVVAFFVKRRMDAAAIQREKDEQSAQAQRVEGPAATGQVALSPAMAAQAQDLYAADRSGQTEALYAAATEAASPTKRRFTCPRCGKTTEEEGLLCLECNSKDSIAGARAAIAEADEMALDVEHPQELLKKAEDAFSAGKFADAIENATEAEDEARGTKERFEEASAFATGKKRAIDIEEEAPAPRAGGPVLGPSLSIGDEAPRPAPRPVARPPVIKPSEGPVTGAPPKAGETGKTEAPAAAGVVTLKPSKCPNCGRDVQPRWKICPNCQTKL